MVDDFAEKVRRNLRAQMNNYADDLAIGACKSFEEYQKLCGVIRGLAIAEEYLLAAQKEMAQDD